MRRIAALLLGIWIGLSPSWAFAQRGAPPALEVAESTARCLTGRLSVNDEIVRDAWVEDRAGTYRIVMELRGRPEVARNFPTAPAADVLSWFDLERRDDPDHALGVDPDSDDAFVVHRGGAAYVARQGGFWHRGVMYDGERCVAGALGVL